MAEFETRCPHCGAPLSVQDEWDGMNVECPQCKQQFTVRKDPGQPAPAAPAVSVPAPAPTPPRTDNAGTFTFVCPSCNAVAELPNSLLGQQYECQMCFETAIAQATTEKQCPYCGQTVKYHAAVCKFCKADLTKAPSAAPKPEETFVFICPECDTVEFLPVSMKGQQYECKTCCETSVATPAEERKCPYCGEKIKIKASICKYCKKDIPSIFDSKKTFNGNDIQSLKNKLSTILAGISTNGLIWRNPSKTPCPENGFWNRIKYLFLNLKRAYLYAFIALVLLGITGLFFIFMPKGHPSESNSEISVSVTVQKEGYNRWISYWKYNCEYKLYANDQLVASKNSTSQSVTFNVKVEKNASLRAEMLAKNGFGGIGETLEGGTVTASYSGQSLTIECRKHLFNY